MREQLNFGKSNKSSLVISPIYYPFELEFDMEQNTYLTIDLLKIISPVSF